ncbi:hypothetical protein ACJMK2_016184 [Sinanodonta woodiana]|uniref:Chitin-binding type-2 domain-containing protein n=1 Tax=Sinanodonta woodiana TaxID=1069815 RepID=A0ABD3UVL9_SINWO
MTQSSFFYETCVPVDLRDCSGYYVDPCDCTQYYQCDKNQLSMFHQPCGPGTVYINNTSVCGYPNDAICQTLRPWERCNVAESRMEHLRSTCFKSIPNINNTLNSDSNTNSISVALITQTILPTVLGVLVPVVIIGLVIHRYRNRR